MSLRTCLTLERPSKGNFFYYSCRFDMRYAGQLFLGTYSGTRLPFRSLSESTPIDFIIAA